MADIAFLLLVFFLVTTTIQTDSGLAAILPQWQDEDALVTPKPSRNVLEIQLNGANALMVEQESNFPVAQLRQKTIDFLNNNGADPRLSDSPKHAVIRLEIDQAADYASYLKVRNALQAAYNRIWNSQAKQRYGRAYEDLSKAQKLTIREDFPKFIAELSNGA